MKIRAGLALLGVLFASSCGVGGLLTASAGGGGGGGGGKPKPPPPTVSVIAPSGPGTSNLVSFVFDLRDPQVKTPEPGGPGTPGQPPLDRGPRVQVEPQFALLPAAPGEEVWTTMTEALVPQSEGRRALSLGQHTFVWNSVVDLGGFTGRVRVRVLASYEDTEGIQRSFKIRDAVFDVDNRLAGTIAGAEAQAPEDVDTFPVDVRPDGDAFLVASLGANIVERVDASGRIERVLGYGLPGDTLGTTPVQNPGVVRLPTLVAFERDAAGNLFTNHSSSIVVTNRGPAPLTFLASVVPAHSTTRVTAANDLTLARGVRFHTSGVLLVASNPGTEESEIRALHPGVGGPVTLAGTTIAPGTQAVIAGGASASTTAEGALASDTKLSDVVALAVGPDGEIYYAERSLGRIRVINPGTTPIVLGGASVAPGTVVTVAGGNGLGFSGDGGPAAAAQLNLPGSLDVSASRILFIADTSNLVIRGVNLGAATRTFAQSTIGVGEIATVAGVHDGAGGGVGSPALATALGTPNGVAVDASGNLLIADQHFVILVNGGTSTVTSYGKTAGPTRTASVYDSTRRGGLPLLRPHAVHSPSADVVYFTDRTTVRVLNLSRFTATFGGVAPDAGATAIVAGGSVPGFSGDGGSARSAALSNPSALATEGPSRLYVADTGNDRIRFVNVNDPRAVGTAQLAFGVPVASGAIATIAGGAIIPLPPYGDGLAPTAASLSAPQGVAVSNAGLVFVADTGHHRIRVMNPGPGDVTVAGVLVAGGTIQTIAGGNAAGFTPDGPGPWMLDSPGALAVDRDLLYFAEPGNARIRVLNLSASTVTCAGVAVAPSEIRTICGNGVRGSAGDGGLGPDARIDSPTGLFVQTLNSERALLYFTDGPQNVLRVLNLTADTDLIGAIDAQGRPTTTIPAASVVTLAGGPNVVGFPNPPAFGGDGDTASAMRFATPAGVIVTVNPDTGLPAHLFVADQENNRLRRVGAPPLVKP